MMKYQPFGHYLLFTVMLLVVGQHAHAGALERLFAPKAEAWPFWNQYQATATQQIDHTPWQQFLDQYVRAGQDGIHRIDYAKVTAPDRQLLKTYIGQLEQTPIRQYNRPQQLAYWINLYNAATIDIILQHYPVKSIQDINISPGFFAIGPWDKKILHIEGKDVSLNDIEHRILRPFWKDPRLHYALNCASLGCPNLQKTPFRAGHLEQQLEAAAREFVNHPRGVRIDDGDLSVSSIYSWFQVDFGDSEQGVIQHLLKYASTELALQLQGVNRISDDNYDWALNDLNPVTIATDDI